LIGFGGANAHAIIESYTPATTVNERATTDNPIPILFSANSEKAMVTQLRTWIEFLEQQPSPSVDIQDLAWTLSRRSALSQRACFTATTVQALLEKLKAAVEDSDKEIGVRTSAKRGKVFGIFTGQGAQWPAMGRGLVQCSPVAEATLKHLDASLQALPEEDRPSWSLHEELFKTGKESRLMEAEFSQPLCTAVQVLLTDMLRAVGVTFEAVVGHSSGTLLHCNIDISYMLTKTN
jgi:hybrid polyketide synthase/nonribosomal peptide synthetase ACE1